MTHDLDLASAADAILKCLAVGSSDDVLLLHNPPQRTLAEVLAKAAHGRAASVRMLEYPTSSRDGEAPPSTVARAMLEATVVVATTICSISHTPARAQASAQGARIAGAYACENKDAFIAAINVDYEELERSTARTAAALSVSTTCRITSAAGTDVLLTIAGREGIADDGNLRMPGDWGNLPAGEAFIAPLETTGDGIIVFDGAFAGYGLLEAPLRVELERGRLVSAEGDAAAWLLATLDDGGEHGRTIAEIGIGTNPSAGLCGEIAIDEKVLGTAHIAFGTSVACGGVNQASVHLDGILLEPRVELDGIPLRQAQPGQNS
ncbi:MAG TPA: aminopeptidase [Gaiellaceae bacterium]|jgi:leucyl aminopeptidase (aminopeptidase T)